MMHQCKFILGNKYTTLANDADNKGGYVYVGPQGMWEILVPPFQFDCEPKTVLKKIKS